MHPWLTTAPGRYLLNWEQERLDASVADLFGFHALQLGLPELDGLRNNRMPHRWLASESLDEPLVLPPSPWPEGADGPPLGADTRPDGTPTSAIALHCDFAALPFPANSLDLVVLPHTLERAADPHQTLREVERVLVPEGRVVILGLNPTSLWGARQWFGRCALRFGARPDGDALFVPHPGDFIGHRRLRDWLRLLSFEVEAGSFGCYRPALRSQRWLERYAWTEPAGDRWWPVFGAAYLVVAVKRVRGMRLIGPAWKTSPKARAAPAVVSHKPMRDPLRDTLPDRLARTPE